MNVVKRLSRLVCRHCTWLSNSVQWCMSVPLWSQLSHKVLFSAGGCVNVHCWGGRSALWVKNKMHLKFQMWTVLGNYTEKKHTTGHLIKGKTTWTSEFLIHNLPISKWAFMNAVVLTFQCLKDSKLVKVGCLWTQRETS